MRVASIQIRANDLGEFKLGWQRLEPMVLQAAKHHDLVLMPECAFPAYFIHPNEGDALQILLDEGQAILERMKEIAKQEQAYIAYGYVEREKEALFNTALLIGRRGEEVVKKRKSFLWHFDHNWFTEGEDVAVAETDFGTVGLVVCADARMPEIVRLAALDGAKLIIDLANLTATGPDISALQNAQSAYMLSTRALENRVWLAVSDKWGIEADSITYTGRSSVFAPDGTCMYQAGSDRDEIVSVDIPTDENGKIVCDSNSYHVQRRPELYGVLTHDTDSLPIVKMIKAAVVPAKMTPYITVAAAEFLLIEDYLRMVDRLVNQGSEIVCMPPTQLPIIHHIERIQQILPDDVIVAATMIVDEHEMKTYLIGRKSLEAEYRTLHSPKQTDESGAPCIYDSPWGKIGVMHAEEALLPEWPRLLMLLGADCIIWPNQLPSSVAGNVARTRAAENRIYVISAQSTTGKYGMSQIIDPNGMVVASTLQNEKKHACGVLAALVNSRVKDIVPGTNVVLNRHPECYRRLTT